MKKISDGIRDKSVPLILFCRGSSTFGEKLASIHPRAISVDWNADLAQMRQRISPNIALQGNLDPDILYAPFDVIRKEVTALLDAMQGDPGYIFNLGHGITPGTPPDAVKTLVDTVKCYSGATL
jgi:uroporphyrinogen decarboxylase